MDTHRNAEPCPGLASGNRDKSEKQKAKNTIFPELDIQPDRAQAERFLTLLDPEAEQFAFQVFDDDKPRAELCKQRKERGLGEWRIGTLAQHWPWLMAMNREGAGVFVMVQDGDGSGRNNAAVQRIRAVFQEDDGAGRDLPLEQHIVVESSPGKHHRYLLVDGLNREQFTGIEQRLIADYGSDPNAKDLARVLRLPGFYHLKRTKRGDTVTPHLVRIVHESGTVPYAAEQVLAALPPLPAGSRTGAAPTLTVPLTAHKALVSELASRAAKRTHEDATLGRHAMVLWLGRECAHRGLPVDVCGPALELFAELMRPCNTSGEICGIDLPNEMKAFADAHASGLADPIEKRQNHSPRRPFLVTEVSAAGFDDGDVGVGITPPRTMLDESMTAADDRAVLAPPIMAPEGFPGMLGEFVEVAVATSEASPVAVAANLLSGIAAAIGRGPYQAIGDGICHPRPFFLFVGKTAKARKGTSEHTPRRVLEAADALLMDADPDHWALRMHDGGLSSGEGIGYELRDPTEKDGEVTDSGQKDKRLLIVEPEFAGVLAAANREKSTLSAVIRNLWDGRTIAPLVKNGKWVATAPHGVIVGHITATELCARLSEVEAKNGFLNRFIILHVSRSKEVPLPEPTAKTDVERLARWLADVLRQAHVDEHGAMHQNLRNARRMEFTAAGRAFWIESYHELTQDGDGLTGALMARSEIYARMLAMIFALLDLKTAIDRPHLESALAWVNYWRGSVEYIFGSLAAAERAAVIEANAEQVLGFLKLEPGAMRSRITKFFGAKLKSEAIGEALEWLLNSAPAKIVAKSQKRSDGKIGRSATTYHPV